ncbi:hypothetical protein BT69DRAFT_1344128 [Atractiella rhizophila]|nr:hypothetical protein BT69DRAFT_1344128 [Atractiella rhizophila]
MAPPHAHRKKVSIGDAATLFGASSSGDDSQPLGSEDFFGSLSSSSNFGSRPETVQEEEEPVENYPSGQNEKDRSPGQQAGGLFGDDGNGEDWLGSSNAGVANEGVHGLEYGGYGTGGYYGQQQEAQNGYDYSVSHGGGTGYDEQASYYPQDPYGQQSTQDYYQQQPQQTNGYGYPEFQQADYSYPQSQTSDPYATQTAASPYAPTTTSSYGQNTSLYNHQQQPPSPQDQAPPSRPTILRMIKPTGLFQGYSGSQAPAPAANGTDAYPSMYGQAQAATAPAPADSYLSPNASSSLPAPPAQPQRVSTPYKPPTSSIGAYDDPYAPIQPVQAASDAPPTMANAGSIIPPPPTAQKTFPPPPPASSSYHTTSTSPPPASTTPSFGTVNQAYDDPYAVYDPDRQAYGDPEPLTTTTKRAHVFSPPPSTFTPPPSRTQPRTSFSPPPPQQQRNTFSPPPKKHFYPPPKATTIPPPPKSTFSPPPAQVTVSPPPPSTFSPPPSTFSPPPKATSTTVSTPPTTQHNIVPELALQPSTPGRWRN